jgi:hypothetical protein
MIELGKALATVLAERTAGMGVPRACRSTHANAVESLRAPQRQQDSIIERQKRLDSKERITGTVKLSKTD